MQAIVIIIIMIIGNYCKCLVILFISLLLSHYLLVVANIRDDLLNCQTPPQVSQWAVTFLISYTHTAISHPQALWWKSLWGFRVGVWICEMGSQRLHVLSIRIQQITWLNHNLGELQKWINVHLYRTVLSFCTLCSQWLYRQTAFSDETVTTFYPTSHPFIHLSLHSCLLISSATNLHVASIHSSIRPIFCLRYSLVSHTYTHRKLETVAHTHIKSWERQPADGQFCLRRRSRRNWWGYNIKTTSDSRVSNLDSIIQSSLSWGKCVANSNDVLEEQGAFLLANFVLFMGPQRIMCWYNVMCVAHCIQHQSHCQC